MNESITIIPMTPFEAYLTTISGEHVCKPTKYESIEPKIVRDLKEPKNECRQLSEINLTTVSFGKMGNVHKEK
jgi:hypothetical protein